MSENPIGLSLLLCVLCLDVDLADRALEQTDLGAVVAGFDQNGFVSDADDLADDAANGGDLVANREAVTHFVNFLFLLLLGADHEEIEEHADQNDHDNGHNDLTATAALIGEQIG